MDTTTNPKGAGMNFQALKSSISRRAAERHAEYPQYDGYFSGPEWSLAEVSRRVRTKAGLAFERGDITIVKDDDVPGFEDAVVAYSLRTGNNTVIERKFVSVFCESCGGSGYVYPHPSALVAIHCPEGC